MMGLLSMGAPKGTELTVMAEGIDEEAAVIGIKKLFDSGFGE
jgi:phosphotransferase system HPr-like phosphotransfer protein